MLGTRALASLAVIATAITVAPSARAEGDCPPGSLHKAQEGFTWCEPTVCETDAQCGAGEVCRSVALCVQVGRVDPSRAALSDGGERLVATQRCAPDKTCPQTTVCSDMKRCLERSDAEKMGLLATGPNASAAEAPAAGAKKSCGCAVPGAARGSWSSLLGAALLALVAARRRLGEPADPA